MAGRSSDRPEEQDYKALGKTGNAPLSTQGSAYALSLYIRCHLPGPGCRRGSGASPAAMNLHLLEISAAVAPGAHAVVIVDQAGWHFAKALVIPHNITLIGNEKNGFVGLTNRQTELIPCLKARAQSWTRIFSAL